MKYLLTALFLWTIASGYAQEETDLTPAVQELRTALRSYEMTREDGTDEETAYAALMVADIYSGLEFPAKALEYGNLALRNRKPGEDDQFDLRLYENLARNYALESRPDSAIYFRKLISRAYAERAEPDRQLREIQQIAQLQERSGDYFAALDTYRDLQELTAGLPTERATAFNNSGYMLSKLGNYPEAIDAFRTAEELDTLATVGQRVTLLVNTGIAYINTRNYPQALKYLRDALKIAPRNSSERGRINHLIGTTYYDRSDWYNAQTFNNSAIEQARRIDDAELLSDAYATGARIYERLYEYEDALDFYQKHLNVRDSLLIESRIRQQNLLERQTSLERVEKEAKLLLANQRLDRLTINRLELERNNLQLEAEKLAAESREQEIEAKQRETQLALLQRESSLRDAALKNQQLAAEQARQQLLLARQQLEAARKDRDIADLQQQKEVQRLKLAEQEAAERDRLQEIELLNRERELTRLELEQQESFRRNAYLIGGLLVVLLGGLIVGGILGRRANRRLTAQKDEIARQHDVISEEKAKSDDLLLNILPVETAQELKEKGFATPRKYESVSVLFTDFVNFTRYAENITAEELINELNTCFVAFDGIVERNGLEKIKTIGDAYMCASGIPITSADHAERAVRAAREMQDFMERHYKDSQSAGKLLGDMRIGIHSGPVVAGVVGRKKFAYDIWGDAVNLAARMEQAGEAGRINISGATYRMVKDTFDCSFRGKIEVKNKGAVSMYFVEKDA